MRLVLILSGLVALSGCTGLASIVAAKDTYWNKSGGAESALLIDYRACRGEVNKGMISMDISLFKDAKVQDLIHGCLRDEKGWDEQPDSAHGFTIPAKGFD